MTRKKPLITAPLSFESRLYSQGYVLVGGVDEVGRGAVAGPVVAAVVILPQGLMIPGVRDSKKLSEKARSQLAGEIKKAALDFGIGWARAEMVDSKGIVAATQHAMDCALSDLKESLADSRCALLIDGRPMPELEKRLHSMAHVEFIVKGDALSHSIAAASILAKVERDNYMSEWREMYPQYGFEKHKGYGTAAHIAAIREHGSCILHRQSFLKKIKEVG